MVRSRVVVATALTLVAVLASALVAVTPAEAAAKPLRASTARPIVGEAVTLSVNLPGTFRRPIVLQRWTGRKWATVRSTRTNRRADVRLTYRSARPGTVKLRMRAPAVRHRGKRVRARKTRAVVLTARAQSGTLVVPAQVAAGSSVVASARFLPARKGRRVSIERFERGAWRVVSTAHTDALGTVRTSFVPASTASYRAVVAPWRGASASVTAAARIVVVPVATPPPPPTTPPPPAEKVARVEIVTDDGTPVTDGKVYEHATMTVRGVDGKADVLRTRLRVRGNSTSWVAIKLPYKVKLDDKQSVLGMPASKDWVLLANFYDRSMLRNDVAFEAARRLGMPWSPRMEPAEVWLNGTYAGLYQLGEGIEVQPGRVELEEGGELLEVDSWPDTDPAFRTTLGLQVFLKSSEDADRLAAARDHVQRVEDIVYSDGYADPSTGYASVLDVDSVVDSYLLSELTKNVDSPFNNSVWMTLGADGTLALGPPWDFDMGMGNRRYCAIDDPTGWFVRRNWMAEPLPGPSLCLPTQYRTMMGHWYVRLLRDPAFMVAVRARWVEVRGALATLPAYVNEEAAVIREAAERTFAPVEDGGAGIPLGHTILEDPDDHVLHGSWDAEATALSSWLRTRVAWLDAQYS